MPDSVPTPDTRNAVIRFRFRRLTGEPVGGVRFRLAGLSGSEGDRTTDEKGMCVIEWNGREKIAGARVFALHEQEGAAPLWKAAEISIAQSQEQDIDFVFDKLSEVVVSVFDESNMPAVDTGILIRIGMKPELSAEQRQAYDALRKADDNYVAKTDRLGLFTVTQLSADMFVGFSTEPSASRASRLEVQTDLSRRGALYYEAPNPGTYNAKLWLKPGMRISVKFPPTDNSDHLPAVVSAGVLPVGLPGTGSSPRRATATRILRTGDRVEIPLSVPGSDGENTEFLGYAAAFIDGVGFSCLTWRMRGLSTEVMLPNPAGESTHWVRCRIEDAESASPLAGVHAEVQYSLFGRTPIATRVTDATGSFRVEGLPPLDWNADGVFNRPFELRTRLELRGELAREYTAPDSDSVLTPDETTVIRLSRRPR